MLTVIAIGIGLAAISIAVLIGTRRGDKI